MNPVTTPVRTVFFGTSEVALPSLEALASDPLFTIVSAVTQPDRPVGRKQELQASPVKETALRLGLPLIQFERVKDREAIETLRALNAPLAVVVSFGQIISQEILDLYPLGVINVHPSLLPRHRGASPMAGAILAGDTTTGVSIMKMDALMDHGPVYAQAEAPIEPTDTTATLSARLSKLGASLLLETLHRLIENPALPAEEQDHGHATIIRRFTKEDGLLDWNKPAEVLERAVRAYHPWPGTYTVIDGKRLKILASSVGTKTDHSPTTRFIAHNLPAIACGDGTSLILLQAQPEGGNILDGKTFLRGRPGWEN